MARRSLAILFALLPSTHGHGYLKTPRSRNLYAYQERDWEDGGGKSPYPEDCPHCLNRGGIRAQCGLLEGIDRNQNPWVRNYDAPKTYRGERMPPLIQETYIEGETIEVEVMVTTHHKGHFVFSACPLVPLLDDEKYDKEDWMPLRIPTEECFAAHRLKFVSDELYGAPQDPTYPERAYIAPALIPEWAPGEGPGGTSGVVGALYKMKFELPPGLNGEVVLIQWYYLTANSCKHEGYADYPFPAAWGSDVNNYAQMEDCPNVPPDGNGVPEQFWNCGEVKIERKRGSKKGPSFDKGWYRDEADNGDVEKPPSPIPEKVNDEESNHMMDSPDSSPTPVMNLPNYGETHVNDEAQGFIDEDFGVEISADELELEVIKEEQGAEVVEDTPAPTGPCVNPDFFGYEGTDDCSAYIWCQNGVAGAEYHCGAGLLFDDKIQMCNWEDDVRCPGALAATGETLSPTPRPTQKPNSLLEWDRSKKKRNHDKTIIGYYASWQWYDRDGLAAPINMDFSKITRANFAFFQITEDGYIYGTDSWADPITLFGFYDWMAEPGAGHEYCSWDGPNEPPVCNSHHYEEGLIYLAHQAGAEVYPSIGGWSLSDPFPVMAANEDYRANFVRQCVALIKNYNFDGIDIDWEYPGYEPHSGTPNDGESWNLLLNDLREALDELEKETGHYYGITAALPCGPSIIDNQDIAHVGKMLTELNLMTYDFHGTWNERVGVNAPLFDQKDSEMMSVHGCVENWVNGGAPREKINIGFPFYGRSFLGAKALYEEFGGAADESMWHEDEGCPQYYNIIKKFKGLTSFRDETTMTQVAYSKSGVLSYDDPRAICDKTEYAMNEALNGYIIWELSGDILEDKSTPLLDAANKKLENPSLDCSTMSDADALVSKVKPEDAGPTYWYPLHDGSNSCTDDGNQPSYYKLSDLFDNEKECCEKHFSWASDCVTQDALDQEVVPFLFYPRFDGGGICINDGNQPSYYGENDLFDNVQDCCDKHFSWNSACVSESYSTTKTSSSISTLPDVAAPFERPQANNGFSHVVHYSPNANTEGEYEEAAVSYTSTIPATTSAAAATSTAQVASTTTSEVYTEPPVETTSLTDPEWPDTTSSTTTVTTSTTTPKRTTTALTTISSTSTESPVKTTVTATSEAEQPDTTSSTATVVKTTSTTTTTKRPIDIISSSSQADGFASSSQQFASFIHAKGNEGESSKDPPTEQSSTSSYASIISNAISHKKDDDKEKPKPQAQGNPVHTANEKPTPQSNSAEAEYRIHVDRFYADLLPFKSGHSLEVRNPSQMAKAVSDYLMTYFASLDNHSYVNKLTGFELECGRSKEKIGEETKLVLNCVGYAVFNVWPPSKREFTDLIHSAFAGRHHGEFLEFMYPTYDHDSGDDPESKIANTIQQSLQDKLDEQFQDESKDGDINHIKQAKKNVIRQKRQAPLPDKRMLRSRKHP